MKRDYELIKRILEAVEEKDVNEGDFFSRQELGIDDVSDAMFNYNAKKMEEAGFIQAFIEYGDNKYSVFPVSLTNAGHDFLDSARNPRVWEKFSKKLIEMGGSIALDVAKELLIQLTKTALMGGL
jgi:hypothetical protein